MKPQDKNQSYVEFHIQGEETIYFEFNDHLAALSFLSEIEDLKATTRIINPILNSLYEPHLIIK